MTIIKRDSAPMGHFHVCDDSASPCDDPEDQMVVAIGREGSGFHRGHRQRACPGQAPFGHNSVERSPRSVCLTNWQLYSRCS
jgi:hypothetical protein